MKKFFKITGITLGVLLVLLLLAPFLFKGSLERLLKKTINENAPVDVEWSDLSLSLIRSFPKSSVSLNNFSVTTRGVFQGDTLASGKKLRLELGLMQLIKGSTPLTIDSFSLDGALIQVKTNAEGISNYDFGEDEEEIEDAVEDLESDFSLALSKYEITNSEIHYLDEKSGIFLSLTDFQHSGKGDFGLSNSELDTRTSTVVSFAMDGTEYLSKQRVSLDALIGMDLENMKFSFLENQAKVNQLPLSFDGYAQLFDDYTEVAITFNTPSSDFKNFLGVIPQEYLKHLDGVKTTGNFEVKGLIEGRVDDIYIPKMDISILSKNASFSYPDLPKTMENINIDIALKNQTGLMKDLYLQIADFRFKIGNNPFGVKGSVHNFMDNPLIDLALNGTLNLGELKEVLPLENDLRLSGIFKADLEMKFDMNSIEKERYDRVHSKGTASLSNFVYSGDSFKNDFHIADTKLSFNPQSIRLDSFQATTGKTDLSASGSIENFIQFMMNGKELKGRFVVNSNAIHLDDFMVDEQEATEEAKKTETVEKQKTTTATEVFKIPAFLDVSLSFKANEIYYDNLILKNTGGTATIANETATISDLHSDLFGGLLALSGNVSTTGEVPKFNMEISIQKVKIEETFKEMEFMRFIAPIANAFNGILDTKINLSGDLGNDFAPKLETLNGAAVLDILSAKINTSENKMLTSLNSQLNFLDLDKLNLDDIHTQLQFNNGEIKLQPMSYSLKDMNFSIEGVHSLTNDMKYQLNLDLPAKYLGKDATQLLAKLSPEDAENEHVLLPIHITGSATKPQVNVDFKAAIASLTADILEYQKDKAKDKVKDKGKELLEGFLPNRGKETAETAEAKTDSTTTTKEKVEEAAKDKLKEGLKDLFNKKKKE